MGDTSDLAAASCGDQELGAINYVPADAAALRLLTSRAQVSKRYSRVL